MNELPEGWTEIKLKDIGICITGLTYSPKNVVDSGLLVLRSSNIQNSKLAFTDNVYVNVDVSEKTKTQYGDILICVRNGSKKLIGKSAFISNLAIGQTHGAFMSLFRPSNTPEYVFQLFQTSMFFRQVNRNLGATINSINNSDLYNFKFPYPPIDERNKIAEILSTWDRAIATTEKQIANSKQQKKALMQQLLTGKKRLAGFSGDWEVVVIDSMAALTAGGTPSTKCDEYWGGEIPWMNSGEINLKQVYAVEGRITELGLQNSSTKEIPVNSVLIALAGQGKTRGTVAINRIKLCTNQSIAAIMSEPDKLDSEFLYFNLDSRYQELRSMSTGDGGRGGLNLSILKSIKVKLPPLPEQQKIAKVLTTADKEISALETRLAHLQQEKKALMQQLLTGKRRVVVAES